jgi:hypothetical protein
MARVDGGVLIMRQPITIRASSFGSLFDCPARWIAIHLEGRRVPQSGKAALGTALHAGTALYDTERVLGQSPSLSAAEDCAVESVRMPRDETDWEGERDKAESIARTLTRKYCLEEAPKHDYVAVEASVESLLISDLNIILTGTTDRIARVDDQFGIRDIKSGKQAVGTDGKAKTKGHAAQQGVYELLAEAATGTRMDAPAVIIGLQTNLTPDKQRIGTGEIVGAKDVLLGDDEHTGLLAMAAKVVHGDIPAWGNPNSMMCHQTYCPNYNTCFWRK